MVTGAERVESAAAEQRGNARPLRARSSAGRLAWCAAATIAIVALITVQWCAAVPAVEGEAPMLVDAALPAKGEASAAPAPSPMPASAAPLSEREQPDPEIRRRVLASIVGLRVTRPEPQLTFHGKRKVVAEVNPSHGTGSGVVVESSGLILTCAHVVGDQRDVRVFLADNREVEGIVQVADRESDLALVEVRAGRLPALDMWTAPELRAGTDVFLASRSGELPAQMTRGTLTTSGTYHVGHSSLEFFRQFSGEVEPGNSGGALLDEGGRFIGLMSVGFQESRIGYAIAREFVVVAIARLRVGAPVIWPWLGMGLETPVTAPGSSVWTVVAGSPAQLAGLRPGDRIVSFEGREVDHFLPMMLAIVARPVGSRFTLGVIRAGTLKARLERTAAGSSPPGSSQVHGPAPVPAAAASGPRSGAPPEAPAAAALTGSLPQVPAAGVTAAPSVSAGPSAAADPDVPKIETVTLISAARPLEPALSPIAVFGRWTGIQLEPAPSVGLDPAGLKVVGLPPRRAPGPLKYEMGSHLIAIVPGVGVVRQLEEGRSDQEMTVRTADDLGEALRESVFGDRVTALLIWSTQGHRETMLMSGEAKRFALI